MNCVCLPELSLLLKPVLQMMTLMETFLPMLAIFDAELTKGLLLTWKSPGNLKEGEDVGEFS